MKTKQKNYQWVHGENESLQRPNVVKSPQPNYYNTNIAYPGSQVVGHGELINDSGIIPFARQFAYESPLVTISPEIKTKDFTDLMIVNLVQQVNEIPKLEKKIDTLTQRVADLTEMENRLEELNSIPVPICDMSRKIPDIEAKVEIKAFLKGLKEKGLKSANLLDIIMATNLASEQIERVMCSLERD